jgi:RpiB/LacA/LacB family sugar-phosphate isomerase
MGEYARNRQGRPGLFLVAFGMCFFGIFRGFLKNKNGEAGMKSVEKIAIGSDHNGYAYKEELKRYLEMRGYGVKDFGQYAENPPATDFSVAEEVALSVSSGENERGILICGSGAGMSIAANKVPGCLAALCFDSFTAEVARTRNNANILAMGSKTIDLKTAKDIVQVWLDTPFESGRDDRRNIIRNEHLLGLDAKYRRR